jgi:hypothetical protein
VFQNPKFQFRPDSADRIRRPHAAERTRPLLPRPGRALVQRAGSIHAFALRQQYQRHHLIPSGLVSTERRMGVAPIRIAFSGSISSATSIPIIGYRKASTPLFTLARRYNETTGNDYYHTGLGNARPADVGRNTLPAGGVASLDLLYSHDFRLTKDAGDKAKILSAGVSALNVLNHTNFASYIGALSSPLFGQPTAALAGRQIQFSVGFQF